MSQFVGLEYAVRLAVLERDGKDGIAVIIVEDYNVVIASA